MFGRGREGVGRAKTKKISREITERDGNYYNDRLLLPLRSCVGRLTGSVSQRNEKPTERRGGGDANGPILGHFILSQFRKGVSSSEGSAPAHLSIEVQGNTDD